MTLRALIILAALTLAPLNAPPCGGISCDWAGGGAEVGFTESEVALWHSTSRRVVAVVVGQARTHGTHIQPSSTVSATIQTTQRLSFANER